VRQEKSVTEMRTDLLQIMQNRNDRPSFLMPGLQDCKQVLGGLAIDGVERFIE